VADPKEHQVLIAAASVHRPMQLLNIDPNDWDDWSWLGSRTATSKT
jgi:hypothetical protein